MLGIPSWGLCLVSILVAVIISYSIIFLIDIRKRRIFNKNFEKQFGKLKRIRFIKNDHGIYDIIGTYRAREIEINHQTSIWSREKNMVIKVRHEIPDMNDEIDHLGYKITPDFIEKELYEWPDDSLAHLRVMVNEISKLEKQPELLKTQDI
jgi:hypothetical protein